MLFDKCETKAKDDDGWKEPGEGYTVSPDNIINSWAPPTPNEDRSIIHGIYGYNEELILKAPEFVRNPPPPSVWQISQGFALVERGQVTFRGIGIHGARVRVGCVQFTTGPGGFFPSQQKLPSGRYWATAKYFDPKTSGLSRLF